MAVGGASAESVAVAVATLAGRLPYRVLALFSGGLVATSASVHVGRRLAIVAAVTFAAPANLASAYPAAALGPGLAVTNVSPSAG